MNWCKLGFHDYQQINISEELKNELISYLLNNGFVHVNDGSDNLMTSFYINNKGVVIFYNMPFQLELSDFFTSYDNARICVRCKKVLKPNIDYKGLNNFIKKRERELDKKDLAKKFYEESK